MADQNMLAQIFGMKEPDLNEKIQEATRAKDLGHISQDTYLKTVQSLVSQLPKTNPLSELSAAPVVPEASPTPVVAKAVPNAPAPISQPVQQDPLAEIKADNVATVGNVVPTGINAGIRDSIEQGQTDAAQMLKGSPMPEAEEEPSVSPPQMESVSMSQAAPQPAQMQQSRVDEELQRLKGAQLQDKLNIAGADFIRGAERAGAGMASFGAKAEVKPDFTEADARLKDPTRFRDILTKDLTAEQSVLERDLKRSTMDFDKQKLDGNSELSKNAREVLKETLKKANLNIPIRDNASLAELEKEYPWMKDVMANEARKVQNQQFQQLRQDRVQEARDDKISKEERTSVDAFQKQFNSYSEKTNEKLLRPAKTLEEMIGQVQTNKMAWSAVMAQLPRIAGEVGVLTDQDIARYSTAPDFINKIKDWGSKNYKGIPSMETIENVKALAEIYKRKAEAEVSQKAKETLDKAEARLKLTDSKLTRADLRRNIDPGGFSINAEAEQFAKKDFERAKKENPKLTLDMYTKFLKKKIAEQEGLLSD